MTDERFEQLVQRLEPLALQSPGRYKQRVLMLALLGNAYLTTILLLIGAVLGGLIASIMVLKALAIKLIIVVGFFLWMILRALWVKIEPPVGTEISASEAPELFAMIRDLQHALDAPRFHHVLITEEFNAGVVQSPRLGIFGWPRNYLLLGLPLMHALSTEQFKAVLAHEFGHLARGHGRVSNWIYRQRLRWSRLLGILEASESNGSFLFKPFLNWFVPYFNAYSFPLARANEYAADSTAARLVSAPSAAQALTAVNVVGSYLSERYWQDIHRQADDQPQPAFAPYSGLAGGLADQLDEAAVHGWLEQALARPTSLADTHPSLSDRLNALAAQAELALPPPGAAADRLLGRRRESIAASFDRRWQESIAAAWEARYREVQDERQKLAVLEQRRQDGEVLSEQERYEHALLTESAGKAPDAALAELETLYAEYPDNLLVCVALGARRLNRDDASGCALLERAMQLDEQAIAKCCELLRDYHWRQGRREEADDWHRRLSERQTLLDAAARERDRVLVNEKFDRHGLDAEQLSALRGQLQAITGLAKVYFVKKRVKHLAHLPCYVLGYRVTGFFRFQRKRYEADALQQIRNRVQFPGETLILSVDGENYRFGRKFAWMRGSRIL
ncbi:M48 family metallopeptidase [Dechloromonas sp. A34]|uniref:M48 family metallopeptidase n=1 Tax=Dechloromonas sp. A34 TaxID=447588 RepID=UPI002248FF49|nr:M48 family metallopeptidase [Dechloromonas sp. A34]